MENILTDDENSLRYVVKVNGVEVSPHFQTPQLAEMQMMQLNEDQRAIAEVVPVTTSGDTLLLG